MRPRRPPRVLLVDDDASARLMLKRFVLNLGADVVEAENAFAALGFLNEQSFELVITDVNMPGRSGVWLLEEIRAKTPDLPVIVMSGGDLEASALLALFGEDVLLVRKPFELVELERLVSQLVPELPWVRSSPAADPARVLPPEPPRPYRYASTLLGEVLSQCVGLEEGGVPWRGRVHPDDRARIEEEIRTAWKAGRRFRLEYRLLTADGDVAWVLHEAALSSNGSSCPTLLPGALLDITGRKREEEELRASEERHRFLTEHSTDVITVLSEQGMFLYVSPASASLLGYEPEELVGISVYEVTHRDDQQIVRDLIEDAVRRPFLATIDYRIRRKDRRYVWFESTSRRVSRSDPTLPAEIICVSRDITARKEYEQHLRELAILDELTGLYNRRGFITLANQQLKAAHRSRRSALVLFADLNNLKRINDTLGHADGDQALIDAAHIFNRTFRESDVVARVGGDEFAILAIETDHDHLDAIRARIESALQLANSDRGRPFELSLSIGAATYDPSGNNTIEELMAWADRAMYEQKRATRQLH